ncbi:phosphoribosylformylglycinamidine cyclo-ligase [Desulfovibrio sp. X2]|uniref:phosphoribosylformylglycinamidine cyclo-ligase n=1 Tax=Desulfovibrio sp. X2 TaxID=941449 RepID=UPI000358AFCE|nr:phosphoribosylformylglycinamidine cyclo-ligase [Desulfovibrio sp. X2]EPR44468.1 phosphoribosylformylglycinamidine cyclo-ligase [Desulfovibrio sp. X2]
MSDRASAYTAAGVNIQAANSFIDGIKKMVGSTFTKGVVTDIGGFGGLFKPDISGMQEPVLVAGTDGVGTKLKLAFDFDRHDSVGIDLVAMSVNDILVQGAKPMFFLDYFATGKLDAQKATTVLAGIVEGCRESECALLGGETAEMPDFYADGEYDLSGFCVGIVDNARIVDGSSVAVGDRIVGLASSGVHSNGYSLVRKLLAESGLKGDDTFPGTEQSVADVLLTPTRIYVKPIKAVLRDLEVKGMAHITGGGFYDNIPRVLPRGVAARIRFGSWKMPPVFDWLKEQGRLSWPEMLQIFNCGIGYVCIVSPDICDDVVGRLSGAGAPATVIGEIEALDKHEEQVVVDFPPECA